MAMSASSCLSRLTSFLFILLCVAAAVSAEGGAMTEAEKDVPQWASNSALQLVLSSQPVLQFTTIPLTGNLGLNESDRTRGIVRISGNLKAANMSNYNQITDANDVAYLSCDKSDDDSFLNPDKMLNSLMTQKPKAIVLYSTSRNWCSISDDEPLPYTSILTMADASEASNVLSHLNSTRAGLDVVISGNATDDNNSTDNGSGGGTNNSTVAMSILYSITGLITLLFLIIIATGAIRAHRHPERYGPRGAFGGWPRQSRAKGLARAVLDTIPIVKFGNAQPAKPDPEQELDNATTDGRDVPTEATAPDLSQGGQPDAVPTARRRSHDTSASASRRHSATENEQGSESNMGCSICTDDFKVGEDVRVLPCNHRFHPSCVDPWLVNVSGTCPLCRLDLRPNQDQGKRGSIAGDSESFAPPLALDGEEGNTQTDTHSRRLSRLFDINRLRQAPVEERMEALRQIRAEADADAPHEAEEVERRHRARLADRLKDKFRIRTRAQSAERREA